MAVVQLFFSTIRSSRYVFPDGSEAAFIDGRYATADEDKVRHLEWEISKGHPYIHRDPQNLAVEESMLDPMEALKAKIIAEYLEKQEAQKSETSESPVQPLVPASSADLVDVPTVEEAAIADLSQILIKK